MSPYEILAAWLKILSGRSPMLSIEITRECPLACPGCYAYGDTHLGGEVTLRQLSDLKGDALVKGVLGLVRRHRPVHVSLVGGEPMVRRRELDKIVPALSKMGVYTLVVTSGVAAIPLDWMSLARVRVAVSVDGLPEHHDIRRKPATYERILRNIKGCSVNIHLTVTHPMLERTGYLDEYLAFWSARPEVQRVWLSTYTPQNGEQSDEMLTARDRQEIVGQLPRLRERFPVLLMKEGLEQVFAAPPRNPRECTFARMSLNYSADLRTRIEPCVFGGTPDCGRCGCAASMGMHWMAQQHIVGPLTASHLLRSSMAIGSLLGRLHRETFSQMRWSDAPAETQSPAGWA